MAPGISGHWISETVTTIMYGYTEDVSTRKGVEHNGIQASGVDISEEMLR